MDRHALTAVAAFAAISTATVTATFQAMAAGAASAADKPPIWEVDFFDDFERFDPDNWQDQRVWTNDEDQCYVPDGQYGTREVSDGTLKLRVIDLGEPRPCDTYSKEGEQHHATPYVAARIITKNRKEFVQGKWTARLRVRNSGQPGMFPAWWLLGALNNEPPVEDTDETVCWPMIGSGELDIFEHHSDGGPDHYAARAIDNEGFCGGGDWRGGMLVQEASLAEYHDYSVEWLGDDIIFRLDDREVHRLVGWKDRFPEPLFAILNFAKINPSPMTETWEMEVDWVKHERLR
jgi:beta-glucanase (GH16 family)